MILLTLQIISALAFILYGYYCVFSEAMVDDFERFKFSKFRVLVGSLEMLGGLGLLIGIYVRPILMLSSLGLATLMFLALVTRLRMKDPLFEMLPAVFLMLVNGYLFFDGFSSYFS